MRNSHCITLLRRCNDWCFNCLHEESRFADYDRHQCVNALPLLRVRLWNWPVTWHLCNEAFSYLSAFLNLARRMKTRVTQNKGSSELFPEKENRDPPILSRSRIRISYSVILLPTAIKYGQPSFAHPHLSALVHTLHPWSICPIPFYSAWFPISFFVHPAESSLSLSVMQTSIFVYWRTSLQYDAPQLPEKMEIVFAAYVLLPPLWIAYITAI